MTLPAGGKIHFHEPPTADDPENWICSHGSYPCDCQGHLVVGGIAWPMYDRNWLMGVYGHIPNGWVELPQALGYFIYVLD